MDPVDAYIALIVVFASLLFLARLYPQQRWAYWLFGYPIGPRTDIKNLTKSQLWSSAWRFLVWGLAFSALLASVVMFPNLSGWGPGAPGATVVVALAFVLLAGLGWIGGLYLLVRFLFRSSRYAPSVNRDA
jgi:hypothetical protein